MAIGSTMVYGESADNSQGGKNTPAKSGTKLKWLPARTVQKDVAVQKDEAVKAVQYAAPLDSTASDVPRSVNSASSTRIAQKLKSDAVNDPFGDAKAAQQTPALQTQETTRSQIQEVPIEPKEDASAPNLIPLMPETKTSSPASKPVLPQLTQPESQPLPGLAPEEKSPAAPPATLSKPATASPATKSGVRSRKTEVLQPQLESEIATKEHELNDSCPSPKDLKKIQELTTNIAPPEGDVPRRCPLSNDPYKVRSWSPTTYTWTASALCHKPLYFDDTQLERYGHSWGPVAQPIVSGVRFFGTFFILPYEMGLEPPCECIYALGDYQPGECAPYLLDPFPISARAALCEAGVCTGAVFLLH